MRFALFALTWAALLAVTKVASAAELERVAIPAAHIPGGVLTGYMMRPANLDAARPVPAIVALHGCGGIFRNDGRQQARDDDWGRRLTAKGYVVLFPDSFGSRGLGSQCTVKKREIRVRHRAPDVMAAASWLADQTFVTKDKLALLGWSHGGSTTLATVDRRVKSSGADYKVAISFYPGCRTFVEDDAWQPRMPLTVLMGGADDWTPPEPCRELGRRAGLRYIEYPGAYHGFDAPNSPIRLRSRLTFSADGSGRAHVGTDPAGRAAAIAEVERTLADAFK